MTTVYDAVIQKLESKTPLTMDDFRQLAEVSRHIKVALGLYHVSDEQNELGIDALLICACSLAVVIRQLEDELVRLAPLDGTIITISDDSGNVVGRFSRIQDETPQAPPTPAAEIVVERISFLPNCLDVTCVSDDALAWFLSTAPRYGQVVSPLNKYGVYRLIVNAAYNIDEVEAFVRAQGR